MSRILLRVVLSSTILTLLTTAPHAARAAEPIKVFVNIPPQACFVEKVGGEHVKVNVLVQPGQSPHTFEPTPRQMMGLSRAALYFEVGMPFEQELLERLKRSGSKVKVIDTAKGVRKRKLEHDHHEHGEHDHHHHEAERDPHIWLSPPLIKIQAANIAEALVQADPAHAEAYRANLANFHKEIDTAHEKLQDQLAACKGKPFYVFHPAFGYFGDAYGLRQVPVETGGKTPTLKQLRALIKQANADGVKVIFAQPQFDRKSAETVASAIGGAVVPMDPLAKDVLRNLADMAEKVEKALRK